MRRFICMAMMALFLITVISGFAESHVHPGNTGIHTVMAVLFVVSTLAHGVINRKA
jgi:hypothetical protein